MVQSVSPPPPTQEGRLRLEHSRLPFWQFPTRLREKMPPEPVALIEEQLRAIHVEVITPLLQARNDDELRERFLATVPMYTQRTMLISLVVWSTLKQPLVEWFPETQHNLQATIERAGPLKIHEQATNDSLSGLSAFIHVMRGIDRAIRSPSTLVQPEGVEELSQWISAFNVALITVVNFLLSVETPSDRATHNAQVLAQWSRYYGAGVYRTAKKAGVLNVPSQIGEDPYTTDEMLTEANAVIADGLESVEDASETP